MAKGNFLVNDKSQLAHGFACRAAGTATTMNTGEDDIHPGDMVGWSVVPRPVGQPAIMPGGQFGDQGPGTRQGTPWRGTPHGKLRFRTVVSKFNDMTPPLNQAVSAMLKKMDQGGISDRPFEHLFNAGSLPPGVPKMSPNEEFAAALLTSDVVTIARGVKLLQDNAQALDLSIATELDIVGAIGVFNPKRSEQQEALRRAIIGGLYMGMPGGSITTRKGLTDFKTGHAGGFVSGRVDNKLKKVVGDLESQYTQVATQLGRFKEVAMARAVHSVARRQIGMALCSSTKGERLDLLIGMFLRSF